MDYSSVFIVLVDSYLGSKLVRSYNSVCLSYSVTTTVIAFAKPTSGYNKMFAYFLMRTWNGGIIYKHFI